MHLYQQANHTSVPGCTFRYTDDTGYSYICGSLEAHPVHTVNPHIVEPPPPLTLRQVKDGTGFDRSARFIPLAEGQEPLTERERAAVIEALEIVAQWPSNKAPLFASALAKIKAGAQ